MGKSLRGWLLMGVLIIGGSVISFHQGRADCGKWCGKYTAISSANDESFGSCTDRNPFTVFQTLCAAANDGNWQEDDSNYDVRTCTACWTVCDFSGCISNNLGEMDNQTSCGDWVTHASRDNCGNTSS